MCDVAVDYPQQHEAYRDWKQAQHEHVSRPLHLVIVNCQFSPQIRTGCSMDGSQSFSRRNVRTINRGTVADHGVPADDDVMPSLLTTGSAVLRCFLDNVCQETLTVLLASDRPSLPRYVREIKKV